MGWWGIFLDSSSFGGRSEVSSGITMMGMLTILTVVIPVVLAATPPVPSIDSIEPAFGEIGSEIAINGSNFDPVESSVFIGGLEADVLSATENELVASVPYGSCYAPISVHVDGLVATSSQRFNVIFDATEELTTDHLSNQLYNPYLGAKYYDVKFADMNGDGVAEMVTSEAGSGSSAYLTLFTTSFDDEGMLSIDQKVSVNFGTGVYSVPQDIALGDLNGDGLLDVVASETEHDNICVFINTSQQQSFSFDTPVIIPVADRESSVQLQDIDGDGRLDVVTTRGTYDQVGVYLNTSDGKSVSFGSKNVMKNVLAIGRPAFADLNADGMIDLVTTSYTSSSASREVFVYSNHSAEGDIEFSLEATIQSGGAPPNGEDWNWSAANPALTDIDGDGRLDIVVVNGTCGGCSFSGLSVIRNTSTDSELLFEYEFSDFYQYKWQSLPLRIHVSDLNGDGKPDVLTSDWMGGISIVMNASTPGNISLAGQMVIGVGGFPRSLATSDLNMDSTPEIAVSNWEVEGMRIVHNFLPVDACVLDGDITGDGVVNVSDLLDVIEGWGVPYDVGNLLLVISGWGSTCP